MTPESTAPVAVFGGSFDPPHVAHVQAVVYALSVGGFQRVLVIPVYEHAFAKHLAPFSDRVAMCELALGWLPGVQVSDLERELATPSLTLRTLQEIHARYPDYALRLLVGADVIEESAKWHAFDAVVQLAPPFVLGRVGYPSRGNSAHVLPDVSSTRVRQYLQQMADAGVRKELREVLPASVLEYIEERGLYGCRETRS